MYTEFYKLSGRPFQLTPDPRFYFDTRTHKKAMAYLTYGLNQGEGFIIITGDIGAGKTMLVGHLFDQLDPEEFVFAKVVTTQLDADNTLRMVAGAFGIATEDIDKSQLLQRIEHFLRAQHRAGRRVLLIIDEAQNLPTGALEELRMLSNFQEGNKALLQSFLLGQPEFRDKLAYSKELEQLRQRVIATHHLEPMALEEVGGYIEHRMKLVDWGGDPKFTKDAYQRVYEFSGGVPRRLNTLCSRLLLFGALEEIHEINGKIVDDVIADLEKDNTPTTGPKHVSAADIRLQPVAAEVADEQSPAGNGGEIAVGENGSMQLELESLDVGRRLEVIEQYVKSHDRTIKKTLEILREWADNET
ncbi:MAG: XrtA-associated ATPase [Sphingomonadales bacterium]|nr:XrtA-associated ATPase [Sphingomonadales bacterium]